jgi:hypothetical protein
MSVQDRLKYYNLVYSNVFACHAESCVKGGLIVVTSKVIIEVVYYPKNKSLLCVILRYPSIFSVQGPQGVAVPGAGGRCTPSGSIEDSLLDSSSGELRSTGGPPGL